MYLFEYGALQYALRQFSDLHLCSPVYLQLKAVSSEAALNNLLYFYSPPVIWLSSTVPVIACSSCDGCSTGAGFKIAAALAA